MHQSSITGKTRPVGPVNWEGLEKRKMNWRELWRMEASGIGFMIGATYDELPSLHKFHQWLGENAACPQ